MNPLLKPILTVTTSLLLIAMLCFLAGYFYGLVALLGAVLILTYLLLGPVNLLEKGLLWLSGQFHKVKPLSRLATQTPTANPRIFAVLVVYFIFFGGAGLGITQYAPLLSSQLVDLGGRLSQQVLDFSDVAMDWTDKTAGPGTVQRLFTHLPDDRNPEAKRIQPEPEHPMTAAEKKQFRHALVQSGVNKAERWIISIVPRLISLMGGTLNGLLMILAGLLLTFYFLIDSNHIKPEIVALFPNRRQATVTYLLESFHQIMFAFIKGQVMLGLLTGGYMFLVYHFLKVPYALLLGCIFAVAELLPVVGTWIGIGIGLTVILFNMPPITALYVWACSYAYQTIKDNILAPKVVGDVMGLHPMVIILALLICAQVAGILGVLLALPLASLINIGIHLVMRHETLPLKGPESKPSSEGATHVTA